MSRDPANAGAVAFKRAGDPNVGEFSDAVVLKKFGNVPEDCVVILVLLLLDDRAGWICRVVARSWSARQLPRLRRSHRVLPQCSDSVAMGAIADTADAHSKRALLTQLYRLPRDFVAPQHASSACHLRIFQLAELCSELNILSEPVSTL